MTVRRFSPVGRPEVNEEHTSGKKEIRQRFLARVDPPTQAHLKLQYHRPDLQRFQPHPEHRDARVQSFATTNKPGTTYFDVDVFWSNQIAPFTNPYSQPAVVTVESVVQSEPIFRDIDGRPITTTAGELIEGIEEDVVPMALFRVEKKIPPTLPLWLTDYGHSTNADLVTFRGLPLKPETLRLVRWFIGGVEEEDGIPFLPVRLDLLYNRKTWRRYFLNRGRKELVIVKDANKNGDDVWRIELLPMLDSIDEPVEEPQFLGRDGRRPRVDVDDRPITIQQELARLRAGEAVSTYLKRPLDPEDIITLEKQTRPPKRFLGVLPIV